jgi:hypothetical protein
MLMKVYSCEFFSIELNTWQYAKYLAKHGIPTHTLFTRQAQDQRDIFSALLKLAIADS